MFLLDLVCVLSSGWVSIHWTDLHTLLGMVDRWVWPAHGLQIYCFSPLFTLYRVHIMWDSVIGLVIKLESS